MTLEFLRYDKELITVYMPAYGIDEVLNEVKFSEGKHAQYLLVGKKLVRRIERIIASLRDGNR